MATFSQEHFLSFSGTIMKMQIPYRVSIGKTLQEGVVKNSGYNRTTTHIALDPGLFDDHLHAGIRFNGIFKI